MLKDEAVYFDKHNVSPKNCAFNVFVPFVKNAFY